MTMDCTLVMGLLSPAPLPGRLIELALLCSGRFTACLQTLQLMRIIGRQGRRGCILNSALQVRTI